MNNNSRKIRIITIIMLVSLVTTLFSACAVTASDYFAGDMPSVESVVGYSVEDVSYETEAVQTLADTSSGESDSVVKLASTFTYAGEDDYWTDTGNYDIEWYGDGTATEFEISTAEELAGLAALVNGTAGLDSAVTFKDCTITLTSNIDLSAHEWTAIGTSSKQFKGTFDGGGYEISGLYINITGSESNVYAGLFGYVDGGTVQNVGVVESSITVSETASSRWVYVGGVVGHSTGAITNCYNTGDVTGPSNSSSVYAGGVVGHSTGAITNCYNTGDVTCASNSSKCLRRRCCWG